MYYKLQLIISRVNQFLTNFGLFLRLSIINQVYQLTHQVDDVTTDQLMTDPYTFHHTLGAGALGNSGISSSDSGSSSASSFVLTIPRSCAILRASSEINRIETKNWSGLAEPSSTVKEIDGKVKKIWCTFWSCYRSLKKAVKGAKWSLTFSFEDVCLHAIHELGFEHLFRNVFSTANHVFHNHATSKNNFKVLIGNSI